MIKVTAYNSIKITNQELLKKNFQQNV